MLQFNIKALQTALSGFDTPLHYVIGFSGGADSSALLHAMTRIASNADFRLSAIHFDHGLHEQSGAWGDHCQAFCARLGVPFERVALSIERQSGRGLEAEAREQRYAYLEGHIAEGTAFLSAHHLDDQAETLLLNLMRSSGVDGLAGMPASRKLGQGVLLRPLLGFSMRTLRDYLQRQGESWIEDPSNEDTRFDRNFLRHDVIPLLESRWPGAAMRISRSAELCRQASGYLREANRAQAPFMAGGQVVPLSHLKPGTVRFAFLLRQWLADIGAPALPSGRMAELERQLNEQRPGIRTQVSWSGWLIQLYRNHLWLQRVQDIEPCETVAWNTPGKLRLGSTVGALEFVDCDALPGKAVKVRARRPGESIRFTRTECQKTIKNILREAGIPPWLRASVPLVEDDHGLLAVGDFIISDKLESWSRAHGTRLRWSPQDRVLQHVHANLIEDG